MSTLQSPCTIENCQKCWESQKLWFHFGTHVCALSFFYSLSVYSWTEYLLSMKKTWNEPFSPICLILQRNCQMMIKAILSGISKANKHTAGMILSSVEVWKQAAAWCLNMLCSDRDKVQLHMYSWRSWTGFNVLQTPPTARGNTGGARPACYSLWTAGSFAQSYSSSQLCILTTEHDG